MTASVVAPRRPASAPAHAEAGGVDAVVHVVAIPAAPSAADLALLDVEELGRADRYLRAADRAAFVTARAAARRCLAAELDTTARRVPIVYDAAGRPRLAGRRAQALDFNVSHAGALAAVAVARGRRVGVDVEWRHAPRPLARLVPDVMGPRERATLATLDGEAFARAFYACWTRKEALVKALGTGLAFPVDTIDLPDEPPDGRVRLSAGDPGAEWTVRTMEPRAGYTLSVALAGGDGVIAVQAGPAGWSAFPAPVRGATGRHCPSGCLSDFTDRGVPLPRGRSRAAR